MFQKFLTITLKSDTIFPHSLSTFKERWTFALYLLGDNDHKSKGKKKNSIKLFENKMSYAGKIQVHEFV